MALEKIKEFLKPNSNKVKTAVFLFAAWAVTALLWMTSTGFGFCPPIWASGAIVLGGMLSVGFAPAAALAYLSIMLTHANSPWILEVAIGFLINLIYIYCLACLFEKFTKKPLRNAIVISVAVLVVPSLVFLPQCITSANNPWSSNPLKETTDSLTTASSSIATSKTTPAVIFDASNSSIASIDISGNSGGIVGTDQICLLKGYYGNGNTFRYTSGKEGKEIALSDPKTAWQVKISVLCDFGRANVEEDIGMIPTLKADVDNGGGLSACDNVPKCSPAYSGTDTCCIVVLRSTS